ncbi:Zn-dependent peptidase ImmA, M78 family [Abditibacterium utsteinense]|uniref:Zn-dependent peptidase ImmA, M78 family n=1 Tax=Abditibacterium utsteinense TaxID=1960156 RepID=A0A2S8SQ82_9BACT|nr:ImmA/IrrE family metallo-endopeptidase [Abditibacterium utsteinense]PQV62955.1 Zn-dependent peptidase ImmA, M78 family [Abditibacterium utsteinense]
MATKTKSMTVNLEPTVLKWARERAGLTVEDLARNFTRPEKVEAWEESGQLTFKQAEKLAQKTYTPFGYLYLSNPPEVTLPIRDFRTIEGQPIATPSVDLVETVDAVILRQQWYRDYAISNGENQLSFVGSLSINEDIVTSARQICDYFGLETKTRTQARNYEEALDVQRQCLEGHGVLVMQSGIVGENTHRALNVEEFRGFALADPYAPVIFINSKDFKAAQMFTLMHELVHICLGVSGVSNLTKTYAPNREVEIFCNAVAAEILVPEDELRNKIPAAMDKGGLDALMRYFKVSLLVILRRLRDLGLITGQNFETWYGEAIARFQAKAEATGGGGNYYNTKISRLGKRFLSAVVENAIDGRIGYKEAFRLLGLGNVQTFRNLAREMDFQP